MKSIPVVNLFGGPGCGKSTIMAGTFFELKCCGVRAEMAPEWFKSRILDGTVGPAVADQLYMSAKQHHSIHRMMVPAVQVVVTDCPIILGIVYADHEPDEVKASLVRKFGEYNNINVFLERPTQIGYEEQGRLHSAREAAELDQKLLNMLEFLKVPFFRVDANRLAPERIKQIVMSHPRCEDSGVFSVNGACVEHEGDACLIREPGNNLASIIGTWPGDETDQELLAALKATD